MGCDVCLKPSVDSEAGSLRTGGEQRPLEVICVCCAVLSPWHLTLCDPKNCSWPDSSLHRDSPGKDPGVGCHFLLQGVFPTQGSNPGLPHCRWILYYLGHLGSNYAAAAAKSLQSCPTLCGPIDGSPPGSPVPGILQARTLEWVAISFSNA